MKACILTKTLGVETNILTTCGEDPNGVVCILNLVINIMSIGVGILGLIGITVVGIQYLTSSGNEEKARKARKRLLEIIIGIATYAVAYGLLWWVLPGFNS